MKMVDFRVGKYAYDSVICNTDGVIIQYSVKKECNASQYVGKEVTISDNVIKEVASQKTKK